MSRILPHKLAAKRPVLALLAALAAAALIVSPAAAPGQSFGRFGGNQGQSFGRYGNNNRRGNSPSATGSIPVMADSYSLIMNRNIFARDRSLPRPPRVPASRAEEIGPTFEASLVLRGVAVQGPDLANAEPVAFFEDTRSGELVRAAAGQALGRGNIAAISLDNVDFRCDGVTRRIRVGENLTGAAYTFSPITETTTQPDDNPDENPVLKAMRLKRQMEEKGFTQ